ncbi:MAG TPA: protein kinase [Kofleriaceae bacterium]|nr:protein kinase [Kofleriaceae bacterium]
MAIKLLHRELASQRVIVDRFFREAKAVNDIRHENIVDVLDFGMLPPPGPDQPPEAYLVMELLEGASLSAVIERDAPLPLERAIRIAIQIADALGAAHRARIVHRDLKPDNVMLIQRGRARDFVKVLDFGIAKQVDRAADGSRTHAGAVIGTPRYMSPEQCQGRGHVDPRADIYSLGIVLYQMLTGEVPFDGEGLGDLLVQQMAMPPLAPTVLNPRIPAQLELVVLKALEKRASDRYQIMDDMITALQDPASYVRAHGGAGGFLRTPILRDPAQSSVGVAVGKRSASPLPVSATTTLSGSVAQLGGALAPRRRGGLVVAMGVVAGASIAASLLLRAGTGHPAASAEPDATAQLAPASVPRSAAVPPAVPASDGDSAIEMAPVVEREPAPSLAPSRDQGHGRGAPSPRSAGPAAKPVRRPEPGVGQEPSASLVEPRRARIEIHSTPPGATVWLDGVVRGVTPYRGEIESGNTPLEFGLMLAGYKPMSQRLAQRSDGTHTFVLQPQWQGQEIDRSEPEPGRRDRIKNPFAGSQRQVRP